MAELAASHVKKLILEGAGDMRVAGAAVPLATTAAATYLKKLGERAAAIARAERRQTIMDRDIESAKQQLGV